MILRLSGGLWGLPPVRLAPKRVRGWRDEVSNRDDVGRISRGPCRRHRLLQGRSGHRSELRCALCVVAFGDAQRVRGDCLGRPDEGREVRAVFSADPQDETLLTDWVMFLAGYEQAEWVDVARHNPCSVWGYAEMRFRACCACSRCGTPDQSATSAARRRRGQLGRPYLSRGRQEEGNGS